MKSENLGPLIDDLCRAAGQKVGIEFRSPPPLGAQVSGRWELGYQPKGLSWGQVLLTGLARTVTSASRSSGPSDSKPDNKIASRSARASTQNWRKCSNGLRPCEHCATSERPNH